MKDLRDEPQLIDQQLVLKQKVMEYRINEIILQSLPFSQLSYEIRLVIKDYAEVQHFELFSVILCEVQNYCFNTEEYLEIKAALGLLDFLADRFKKSTVQPRRMKVIVLYCSLITGKKTELETFVMDQLDKWLAEYLKALKNDFNVRQMECVVEAVIGAKRRISDKSLSFARLRSMVLQLEETTMVKKGGKQIFDPEMYFFEAIVSGITTSRPVHRVWVLRFLASDFQNNMDPNVLSQRQQEALVIFFGNLMVLLKDPKLSIEAKLAEHALKLPADASIPMLIINIIQSKVPIQSIESWSPTFTASLCDVLLQLFSFGNFYTSGHESQIDDSESVHSDDHSKDFSRGFCDDKAIAEILAYANLIIETASVCQIMVSQFKLFIRDSKPSVTIQLFKRLALDLIAPDSEYIQTAYMHFLDVITLCQYSQLLHSTMEHLKYVLAGIALNWELVFYSPLTLCMKTDVKEEVAELYQKVVFLIETVGEVKFWFGLDTWRSSESMMSIRSEDSSEAPSKFKAAGEKTLNVPGLPKAPVKVKDQFLDLLCLVVLGHKVRPSGQLTSGQWVVYMELISSIRRIRIISRTTLFVQDVRESLKLALLQVERKLYAVVKFQDMSSKEVASVDKVMLCNYLTESRAIIDNKLRPFWYGYLLQWINVMLKGAQQSSLPLNRALAAMSFDVGTHLIKMHELLLFGFKKARQVNNEALRDFYEVRLASVFPNGLSKADEGDVISTTLPGALFNLLIAQPGYMEIQEINDLFMNLWNVTTEISGYLRLKVDFLLMYLCEIDPELTKKVIYADFYSDDSRKRLKALKKFTAMFLARKVVLQQQLPFETTSKSNNRFFIVDSKSLGKLFKQPSLQLPFVTPEIGNDGLTVINEPEWLQRLKDAARKVRARDLSSLSKFTSKEISDDSQDVHQEFEEKENENERLARIDAQVCLLPTLALSEAMRSVDMKMSKVRTIFPASLSFATLALSDMLLDTDSDVSTNAREVLNTMMLNDPSLLLRIYFNEIVVSAVEVQSELFCRLKQMVHMRKNLPYGFVHMMLNFCVGYLKFITLEPQPSHMIIMNMVLPLISDLTASVNGLMFKEFKRLRLELQVFNSGAFFFPSNSEETLYPMELNQRVSNIKDCVLTRLPSVVQSAMTMRMAQSQLMLQFILKYPKDVADFRKHIFNDVTLSNIMYEFSQDICYSFSQMRIPPNFRGTKKLDTFLYFKGTAITTEADREALQVQVSCYRMWLSFVDMMMSFVPKSYSNDKEMKVLLSQVNRCLITYRHDYSVVAHCLAIYLNVATRFRKLFLDKGYNLFIVEIFQLYLLCRAEKGQHSQVEESIVLCWKRFFHLHQEAFALQAVYHLQAYIMAYSAVGNTQIKQENCLDAMVELFQHLKGDLVKDTLGVGEMVKMSDKIDNFLDEFTDLDVLKLIITTVSIEPDSFRSSEMLSFMPKYVNTLLQFHRESPDFAAMLRLFLETLIKIYGDSESSTSYLKSFARTFVLTDVSKKSSLETQRQNRIAMFENISAILKSMDGYYKKAVCKMLTPRLFDTMFSVVRRIFKDLVGLQKVPSIYWLGDVVDQLFKLFGQLDDPSLVQESLLMHCIQKIKAFSARINFDSLWSSLALHMSKQPKDSPQWKMFTRRLFEPIFQYNVHQANRFPLSMVDAMATIQNYSQDMLYIIQQKHSEVDAQMFLRLCVPFGIKLVGLYQETRETLLKSSLLKLLAISMQNVTIKHDQAELQNSKLNLMVKSMASLVNIDVVGAPTKSTYNLSMASPTEDDQAIGLKVLAGQIILIKLYLAAFHDDVTSNMPHFYPIIASFVAKSIPVENIKPEYASIWKSLAQIIKLQTPLNGYLKPLLLSHCKRVQVATGTKKTPTLPTQKTLTAEIQTPRLKNLSVLQIMKGSVSHQSVDRLNIDQPTSPFRRRVVSQTTSTISIPKAAAPEESQFNKQVYGADKLTFDPVLPDQMGRLSPAIEGLAVESPKLVPSDKVLTAEPVGQVPGEIYESCCTIVHSLIIGSSAKLDLGQMLKDVSIEYSQLVKPYQTTDSASQTPKSLLTRQLL